LPFRGNNQYTEGTGREAPSRGARTANKATSVDVESGFLIGNVFLYSQSMCALMSFYTPIDYESVRTVSIFGFLYTTLLTDIFKYLQQPKPTLSVRESYCAAEYHKQEITKPNEDEIREDGNSGISTNIETYVSCCI